MRSERARIAVEQIRSHDLEIVVGRVREGAAPVAIAQRQIPARWFAVDRRPGCSAGVDNDASLVQPEIIGIGPPADGEQQVRPPHLCDRRRV